MSVEAKKLIDLTLLSRFKELMDQSVDDKLSSSDPDGLLLEADADKKYISTATNENGTITLSRPDGSTVVITIDKVGHATQADQDGAGNVIADTYETKADAETHLSKSDAEETYQKAADIDLATTEDIDALFA